MPKLKLTFACGLYDRVRSLYTGAVPVEGVDLNFVNIDSPREIFDRMSASQEFDASEYSSSEFISRYSAKQCPFVAIPVFPSRSFRHGFIAVNRKLVKTAKDLEGGRIGLPMYTMTASIFIKGLLAHECGVDLSNVTWVEGHINAGRGPVLNGRNGEGDRYQSDGEIEISRLAKGCGSRVAAVVKLDDPVAVKIKNRVWRAIVRTLRAFS